MAPPLPLKRRGFRHTSFYEAAGRLLEKECDLLVPDLFYLEVANVLWKRVRKGELTEEEAMLHALHDLVAPHSGVVMRRNDRRAGPSSIA